MPFNASLIGAAQPADLGFVFTPCPHCCLCGDHYRYMTREVCKCKQTTHLSEIGAWKDSPSCAYRGSAFLGVLTVFGVSGGFGSSSLPGPAAGPWPPVCVPVLGSCWGLALLSGLFGVLCWSRLKYNVSSFSLLREVLPGAACRMIYVVTSSSCIACSSLQLYNI